MTEAVDVTRGLRRTREARDRASAEPFPAERIEAQLQRLRWVVVVTRSRSEFAAIDWLAGRGVFAWTPTRTVYRRANRAAKEKRLRTFAAAPGYVVVGLDPVFERWASVFACPHVHAALGPSGRPMVLREGAVRLIMRLTWVAPAAQRHMRSGAEFRAGDVVRVCDGPYDGHESPVLEIDGDEAVILAEVFGAARPVHVRLDKLAKVA